jgi:predicted nuclease of predicted toxin-antitoxin system
VIFLVDEDVDHSVGDLLADRHDVRFVVNILGSGAKDPAVEQYVRAQGVVLVTADNGFARRLRQRDRRLPCLWLHDLVTEERNRVAQLLEVIEREAELAGDRLHMEIRLGSFHVQR